MIIYITGVIVAFIMSLIGIYYDTDDSEKKQYGLVAIVSLLSWISVALMSYYLYQERKRRKLL